MEKTMEEYEEMISDRTQPNMGAYEDKVIGMVEKYGPARGLTMEQRMDRWRTVTKDNKMTKFRKAFVPQTIKRKEFKEPYTPVLSHIAHTPKGKYGMPLQPFPEFKYDHQKLQNTKDDNHIDYSVDEYDMEWLEIMAHKRMALGFGFISVPIFEFWVDRLEKFCIWKPKEFVKLKDENGEEVDDVCNICLDGDTSNCNQIVYCDRCNLTVHQDCYGIPFIPDGCLECRRCSISPAIRVSCVLCPSKTGAFKQVDHEKWVHVLCVIWVDETHFGNTIFMENVQNIDKALHDRRALSCLLCKNRKNARMGACIQCSEAKCTASFHVTCARNSGLVMRINETDDGVSRFVWCPKHAPPLTDQDREQRKLMLRNARRENERKLPAISMPTLTTSIISTIREQQPVSDYREIVNFWYQKRQNRLGAPLLKNYKPTTSTDSSLTPVIPRRISRNSKSFEYHCEAQKQMEAARKSISSSISVVDLVVRREEMKADLITNGIQTLKCAFKPTDMLCISVIEELKSIDNGKVFAEPVDLHGYKDIIKHPISLRDMSEKAAAGKYSTVSALTADVNLMLTNCAQFNKGNRIYIKYGNDYRKNSTPILEVAEKEEAQRLALRDDAKFMSRLLNGIMNDYCGWSNKKTEVFDVTTPHLNNNNTNRRRRRQNTPPEDVDEEVEPDVKMEVEELAGPSNAPAPPTPMTSSTRKAPRKRGNQEQMKDDDEDLETKPSSISKAKTRSSTTTSSESTGPASGASGASPWFGAINTPTLRKRGAAQETEKTSSKKTSEVTTTPSSALRQTTLTSYFGGVPKQQVQHVTFATDANKSVAQRSLFDTPSTSKLSTSSSTSTSSSSTSTSSATSTRPSTRSNSTVVNYTPTTTPSITRRTAFRISSAALQSPLPTAKKIGVRALDSDDDDDEIILQTAPHQMSAEEIQAEKLKSAENEAMSKFAHNQLVIVEGRAAKVIDSQVAHLTDIHYEQRLSMMKKRREVLSEISQTPVIYVEFFQKSANLDSFKWMSADKVELLDLNNVNQRSPKIPGLKAAREWHQKVINGDIV